MTTHFAFPNVNPEFIGCGRYAAFDQSPPGYTALASLIIAPEVVERAAAVLAPTPPAPTRQVYERKDRPDEKYAGSSLHLAYLLAVISRTRAVRATFTGDLWCTGRITFAEHTNPQLQAVDAPGFRRKLDAFLSAIDNPQDRIFIVPVAQIHATQNLMSAEIDLCTLRDAQHDLRTMPVDRKTIITVQPDELPLLISVIFQPGPNPYKGLEAFTERDSAWFFGREPQIEAIWQKYTTSAIDEPTTDEALAAPHHFLAILGASGSGKSSLARAGFLPKFNEGNLPEAQRPQTLVLRPGGQPLQALLSAVVAGLANPLLLAADLQDFRNILAQSPRGLSRIIDALTTRPVVIVLDQFEEIYALEVPIMERQQVIANLLNAAEEPSGQVFVVITLRTDFLNRTRHDPELDHAIAQHNVLIPAMNRAQLRAAITEPAQRAGYVFDVETVDTLIAATADNDGALPLLQFALLRIWEGLHQGITPAETLLQMHGVGGALAHNADRILGNISPVEQRIARRIFLKLVHLDERTPHGTRRRVPISEFVAQGETIETIRSVLHQFAQPTARLLTLREVGGVESAEITHEALLTHWGTLSAWLSESAADMRFERRLAQEAQRWDAAGRPDDFLWRALDVQALRRFARDWHQDLTSAQWAFFQAAERRLRQRNWLKWGAVSILLLLTVISVIGGFWARAERQRAEQYRALAENNTIAALHVLATALFRTHDELGALVAAVRAGQMLPHTEVAPELHEQVITTLREILGRIHEQNRLRPPTDAAVLSIVIDAAGTRIAAGQADGTLTLWDMPTGRLLRSWPGHSAAVLSVAFHPTAPLLASGSFDQEIRLWDLATGQPINILQAAAGMVYHVAFSPDGIFLAAGYDDQTIRLWEMATGREIRTLRGHAGFVYSVAFSPDGTRLASGSDDQTVNVWDVASGNVLATLRGHTGLVYCVAFHPEGQLLASGSTDRTIRLWDTTTWQTRQTLAAHTADVRSLDFQATGDHLASAGGDAQIELWSLAQSAVFTTLQAQSAAITQVQFTPNGKLLVSASRDGVLRLWDTASRLPPPSTLDELVQSGCAWLRDYLATSPDVSPADRRLCSTE